MDGTTSEATAPKVTVTCSCGHSVEHTQDCTAVPRLRVSPAAAACPRCDRRGNMQWQWKPDAAPERERLRCYVCGWDTGWIRYGTIQAQALPR